MLVSKSSLTIIFYQSTQGIRSNLFLELNNQAKSDLVYLNDDELLLTRLLSCLGGGALLGLALLDVLAELRERIEPEFQVSFENQFKSNWQLELYNC